MDDCYTCINYESDVCYDCMHYDQPLNDFYVKASPELIIKREAEYRKRLVAPILGNIITVNDPNFINFVDVFYRIEKFADKEFLEFIPVYAGETSLTASNGFYIIELYCYIPKKLRNRPILYISKDNIVTTATESYTYTSKQVAKLWNPANTIRSPKLIDEFIQKHFNLKTTKFGIYHLMLAEQVLRVNSIFIDPILEELGKLNAIGYGEERDPFFLSSPKGRAVIMTMIPDNV